MKRKLAVIACTFLFIVSGCGADSGNQADTATLQDKNIVDETQVSSVDEKGTDSDKDNIISETQESIDDKEKDSLASGKQSLAQRLCGRYSYHDMSSSGEEIFHTIDMITFGDNLYAFCAEAMPDDDYESLDEYSFWVSEFIPFNADDMKSKDNDSVRVNELRFSIMSNAGKYWDSGHAGTITLTDEGLVFEGFDHEGFLVPDNDESRLFLKDDRVEDAFGYVKDGKGDDELEGLWILDLKGADLYIEFSGANMYMYSKDPGSEVFYAGGGCEYSDGAFLWTASCLGAGGMPIELDCKYETDGDVLRLSVSGYDLSDEIPAKGKYTKIKDGGVHVTTMDEVKFDSDSFGGVKNSGFGNNSGIVRK